MSVEKYEDLISEAEKPYSQRKPMIVSKNGQVKKVRRFHLTDEQVQRIKTQYATTGGVINPYALRQGLHWGQVEALINLGVDEWHSHKTVREKIKEILSSIIDEKTGKSIWEKVLNRKPRNPSTAKDIDGKILDNYHVLQRLNPLSPYGYKLLQFNMAIDIEYKIPEGYDDPALAIPYYRLHTKWKEGEKVGPTYSNKFAKRGRKPKDGS